MLLITHDQEGIKMLRFFVSHRELYNIYKQNPKFNASQRQKAVVNYLLLIEKLYDKEKVVDELKRKLSQSFFNNLTRRITNKQGKRIRWERFENSSAPWLEENFYFLYFAENYHHESRGMYS